MKPSIYLDYAAATPMDSAVLAAMQPYFTDKFYNPSATYLPAANIRNDLDEARARIANLLGARPGEIVFTAGGTEANNLAIHGIMSQFPGSNLIVSAVEHESVLAAAHQYNHREAPVNSQGLVDVDKLAELINEQTVLVSVMYANNEVGTIQPIRQISQKLDQVRRQRQKQGNELPIYFHTDAAQAAAYLDLHASRLDVDLMTINGGKIYGPKQTGVLFVSHKLQLTPQILGGGQERGLRSGTENVAGFIGLATALDLVQDRRHEESERLTKLQEQFLRQLSQNIPTAIINGSLKNRLPNNIHITLPGKDNERLLLQLEQEGILAAAGSACSASNEEPSHVLRAMGLGADHAQSSLRFTMGRQTTLQQVNQTIRALERLAKS